MLFNKNDKGSEELKGAIGWIYKSVSFENLSTYLFMAKRHIINIIGQEIYLLAWTHYLSDNYENEMQQEEEDYTQLDELVHKIQLPLALLAYRKYAPGVDIQHSEQGRQISVTENLKPAFEWMIERDNVNILDLFHESVDMLLEFLDSRIGEEATFDPTIGEVWAGSTAYKQSKSVILSSATAFDAVYPIENSRRLYISMLPFIREVENRIIKPIITNDRYDGLIERRLDKEQSDEDKRIIELSSTPIALQTMSIALKRLNVEVLPDRVIQNYSSLDPKQTRTADSMDRRALSMQLEMDSKRELIALQKYIRSLSPVATAEEEKIDKSKPFFMA